MLLDRARADAVLGGAAPVAARVDRPVVADTALAPLLGQTCSGRVLAVFPTALYAQVDTGTSAVVLTVGTSDGVRLPGSLTLAATSARAPFAPHTPGDAVHILDGVVGIGAVGYRPVRWWSARRVVAPATQAVTGVALDELAARLAAAAPQHDAAVAAALDSGAAALEAALAALDPVAATQAAGALLGLGPGLTPAGDDVLAGVLVTCSQLRTLPGAGAVAACADIVGRHVLAMVAVRTNVISASLLGHAARGCAAEPVLGLVEAVTGSRPLGPALDALLAVGHTSGHDTARGVLLGANVLLEHATGGCPPPGTPRTEEPR